MIISKTSSAIPDVAKTELEAIFQNIVPPMLKLENPVLYDLFFLFLRAIEPTTRVSFDFNITNNEDFETLDTKLIKKHIVGMFLATFSEKLYASLDDSEIINDLKKFLSTIGQSFTNIDRDYIFDDGFNFTEDLVVFAQKNITDKGKANPYYYYAKLLARTKLVFDDPDNFFVNVEIGDDPFKYNIEGSIRRVLFNQIVRPLAHPVGFAYEYINRAYNVLEDLFDVHEDQSDFLIKIVTGTKVLNFSENVSYVEKKKDLFGKELITIFYKDGSRIFKESNGILFFYNEEGLEIAQKENSAISVFYNRKFSTKVVEVLLEKSNKFLASNYFGYTNCWTFSDDVKLGVPLKICSFRKNTKMPETFETATRGTIIEDITPMKKVGLELKLDINGELTSYTGKFTDFENYLHYPFVIEETGALTTSEVISDSINLNLNEETTFAFDYNPLDVFYLDQTEFLIGFNFVIGGAGLVLTPTSKMQKYIDETVVSLNSILTSNVQIPELVHSYVATAGIDDTVQSVIDQFSAYQFDYPMFERLTTGHFLGEGITLGNLNFEIVIRRAEDVAFPTMALDFEIINK